MNDGPRAGAGPPLSPCIKVCVMDGDDRYCTGCLRTRAEIAQWWLLRDDAKRAVLAALPERLARRLPPAAPG